MSVRVGMLNRSHSQPMSGSRMAKGMKGAENRFTAVGVKDFGESFCLGCRSRLLMVERTG